MTLIRKQTSIPIQKETDVCVIGGGPAGIGAAVAAARHNKHVILIEKRGFTGGNVTACYVENPDYFMAGTQFAPEGIYAEIESGFLSKFGNDNVRPKKNKSFNSETLKCYLDDYLLSNGVQLMLHSFVNDVICEDDIIRAVIIQTKKGPAAITAKTFIDATGDGDVAYAAGVPCDIGRDKDGKCQPGTVAVRLAGANVKELLTDGDKLQKITKEFRAEYQKGNIQLTCKRQDIPNIYVSKEDFISRYCFDEEDANSIYANLMRAYDNAIVLREEIGSEALSYIQLAVYAMNKAKFSDAPLIQLQNVVDNIVAFWGMVDDDIDSECVRSIIRLGKRVERIDLYARMKEASHELKREMKRLNLRIQRTAFKYNTMKLAHLNYMVEKEPIYYDTMVEEIETLFDVDNDNTMKN